MRYIGVGYTLLIVLCITTTGSGQEAEKLPDEDGGLLSDQGRQIIIRCVDELTPLPGAEGENVYTCVGDLRQRLVNTDLERDLSGEELADGGSWTDYDRHNLVIRSPWESQLRERRRAYGRALPHPDIFRKLHRSMLSLRSTPDLKNVLVFSGPHARRTGIDPGFKIMGLGKRGYSPGFKVMGLGKRGYSPGFKVMGLGKRGYNPGLKLMGLGKRGMDPGFQLMGLGKRAEEE